MAHEVNHPNIDLWYVAYTLSSDVFHFGKMTPANCMSTGQDKLFRAGTESAIAIKTNQLKGVENWYEDNINSDS